MENLIIYESPYSKIRVGRPHDGGYVICMLPDSYDLLLSCGIANDISFEQHMLYMNPNLRCIAFDGTIDKLPLEDPRIYFIKKNIGPINNEYLTNLKEYIETYNDIFLKMDIEGHEFDTLDTFTEEQFLKIKQIVIEIHTPGDIELHPTYFKGLGHITNKKMFSVLKKINKTHTLVHLHGNNGCKTYKIDNIIVPNVFECTFIRNDYIKDKIMNREPVPTDLDMPNIPDNPEYNLSYWPFMTSYIINF
jgi:hypothetical protein